MSSLDHGEVAGNLPAFFWSPGGFGDPVLCLTAISLNYNLAYSFVVLFIYKLENCFDIGINVSVCS